MALEDWELVQRLQQCWIQDEALQARGVGFYRETRRGLFGFARDVHLLHRLQDHRVFLTDSGASTDSGADAGAHTGSDTGADTGADTGTSPTACRPWPLLLWRMRRRKLPRRMVR